MLGKLGQLKAISYALQRPFFQEPVVMASGFRLSTENRKHTCGCETNLKKQTYFKKNGKETDIIKAGWLATEKKSYVIYC